MGFSVHAATAAHSFFQPWRVTSVLRGSSSLCREMAKLVRFRIGRAIKPRLLVVAMGDLDDAHHCHRSASMDWRAH